MKIIDISPISSGAAFPYKAGSLQFLQDAVKELSAANAITIISTIYQSGYSPSIPYVMNGCINFNISGTQIIGAGVILYNGELYNTIATSFTSTGTIYGNLNITQYTTFADPVELSDTSVVNMHNIRQVSWSNSSTGALFQFSNCVFLNQLPLVQHTASHFNGFEIDLDRNYDFIFTIPAGSTNVPTISFANASTGAIWRGQLAVSPGQVLDFTSVVATISGLSGGILYKNGNIFNFLPTYTVGSYSDCIIEIEFRGFIGTAPHILIGITMQ